MEHKTWVAGGLGLALLVTIVGGELWTRWSGDPKIVIGKNDDVYYYRRATREDARALGEALRRIGFFNDRGTSVLLWKGSGAAVVSFVLNDGAWDHPNAVANFAEIGRRIATTVGGFPIKVALLDRTRTIRKELTVGKTMIGVRDSVYYFGTATLAEANALGQALRDAGYFEDLGASVVLLKGQGTVLSLVVQEGLWDRPDVVANVELLARRVAPSVGGLPVRLRLLNSEMESRKELAIR